MGLKMNQAQKMIQSQVMTPQMQQAIKMLTLTHLEMTDMIAQEMVENPLLEEVDEPSDLPQDEVQQNIGESENQEVTAAFDLDQINQNSDQNNTNTKDDFDWEKYIEPYSDYSAPIKSNIESGNDEDVPQWENIISKTDSLVDHLKWQIRMEDLSEQDIQLAELIIHNINDDGFLDENIESMVSGTEYELSKAKEVLAIIKRLDPVGCGSSSPKEALLVQAEHLEETPFSLLKIIEHHLEDIYKKNFELIQKKLKISLDEIKLCEQILSGLNPRPGRQISSEEPQYIVPDIYVRDVGGQFVVEINNDGIPDLKISKMYKSLLQQPQQDSKSKEFVKDKLRSAVWLLKSIENRQKTIEKVANAIVKFQPDFLSRGKEYLRPMILKDIAQEIGMHESTVSRVTTNKYMHTPMGVYELKYFFNSGVGGKDGGSSLPSEVIKMKLKVLIDREDKKKPLSDDKIVIMLNELGMEVSRRTVAKYRDEMGIMASSRRKRSI